MENKGKISVGIIVAIEINAVFEIYKDYKELPCPQGFKLFLVEKENCFIYILQTGVGECYASSGCQFLISKYNVSMIVNFGVVGGLTKEMKQLKVCLVDKVVHYKYDCSEYLPLQVGQVEGHDSIYLNTDKTLINIALSIIDDLPLVTCCSGDKFVGTEEEKTYLHERFNGDICDMESAGIVLTCELNKVPCILFKAVSDGLSDGAEGFFKELQNASIKCLRIANDILDKIANVEF
ncbi:MAG: 5'-methylthioadenosine/S-adenosylhomocysteine nucleosidase [Firmicutes bacterium]|nr:5'-methylthioadenosine/S-adenosylhomocysteine nucleosidase [Candidatus Caballimonas caccae]